MLEAPCRRGDVYVVDFRAFGGSLDKPRPAVVVSVDAMNRAAMYAAVAPLRSAEQKRMLPCHAFVPAGEGGLIKSSLVDVGHVATVHQRILSRRLGRLGAASLERVDAALRFYFGV